MTRPTRPIRYGLPALATLLALAALLLPSRAWAVPGEALELLSQDSIKSSAQAIDLLAEDDSLASGTLLAALLDGSLYLRKADHRLVVALAQGEGYSLADAVTGEDLGPAAKEELGKVPIRNSLRTRIRGLLTQRSLTSPDAAVRRAASAELLKGADDLDEAVLARRLAAETDATVRENLEAALALKRLAGEDPAVVLASIAVLKGNLDPAVRTALTNLKESAGQALIAKAAGDALGSIESKANFYAVLEMAFFGVSLGSVLVLAAIGLAITFGVMGVINMAHGELMMLGAYTTYVIQQAMPGHIGLSLPLAVPAAFLVSAAVGILIERVVIRMLYGRPLETLLATFGVSLILQQAVRTIFSPLNRSVVTPAWMSGSIQVNPVFSITWNRLCIVFFCLMVFAALSAVLRRTRLGLEVRAVSQNRAMARVMGVKASLVDALTFGLGSGIAGVAGVALSQLTNVGPNLGQSYIIDSFMVVVFGGVGNLWGTLVAGLSLGVVNKALEPLSGAVLAKIIVLIGIILFIQKRPTGLFPQKGRAVEG